MDKKYDVFISYRRDGGESTAKMLHDKLENLGYRVFFDVESLRSGDFNKALYSVIEECHDFLLVLSPGALDRCQSENDWVRLEIEHALERNLNIIPIMLRSFVFPEELPASIDGIRYKNGIESNYQFFDAFITKLQSFLKSESIRAKRRRQRILLSVSVAAACLFIALAAWLTAGRQDAPYPGTNHEKNVTGNLVYYLETNMQQLEQASECLDKSYRACNDYLTHIDTASRSSLLAELYNNRKKLKQIKTDDSLLPDSLYEELKESPFSLADVVAMHDYLVTFIESSIDNIDFIEVMTDENNVIDTSTMLQIISSYQEIFDEERKSAAYATNELLLVVENEEVLDDFKYIFLPSLYYTELQASNWCYDVKTLRSDSDKSWNTMQRIQSRIVSLVGDDNMEVMLIRSEMIQQLVEEGVPRVEAEAMVKELSGKIQLVTLKETTVDELRQELADKYEQAREKFAPSSEDDSGLLWGKMLRFLKLSLYDDAIKCIGIYREKVRGTDEYAEEYCAAAIRFINNIGMTGVDYGVMVAGYDPEGSPHEQYKIGDVIIAVNGMPCHHFDEYSELRGAMADDKSYTAVVLRKDEDNPAQVKQVSLDIPADAPRVLMISMQEKDAE